MTEPTSDPGLDRRGFIQTGAAIAAGGALLFGAWSEATASPGTRLPTRVLGRTGLRVSTVSLGGLQLGSAASRRVLEHAIDQGMNLVHTCPGYNNGQSMRIVGEVMKTRRDKVVLLLKTPPGNIDNDLRVLNTDHVDLLIPEACGNLPEQNARQWQPAFARLKQQGKIRFAGFATHHEHVTSLQCAIRTGFYDACLLAYNVGNREMLNPVVAECVRRQRMGFLAMKTSQFPGDKSTARFQANIRTILGNGNVATVLMGIGSIQHVDQVIAAVLQQRGAADAEFAREVAACSGTMCSMCGACQAACPEPVAVAELLRADLYRRRGDLRLAREVVQRLSPRCSPAGCTGCGKCNEACDRGIDVMRLIGEVAG